MRKALIALAVVLAACSPEPEPAAPAPIPPPPPAPAPAPEPEPKTPYTYGDDATLDRLWDRCDDGDYDACDTLFWDSPLNSRYEQHALDRLDQLDREAAALIDEISVELILDMVWLEMTATERQDVCLGVDLFGADASAEIVVGSAGGGLSIPDVAAWLTETCR